MEKIIINGAAMLSRALAHEEIARALSLPEYYGRNLDALWDLVSTMDANVVLASADALRANLGDYGESLIATLEEASQENPCFRFEAQA